MSMDTKKKFASKKQLKEANKYDYEAFLKHLNRVSKNKEVKEFILLYYNNLKKQNIVLRKSDFDFLIVKEEGKSDRKVEQKLVTALFEGRSQIRAEEAFTYNFIHYLRKVQVFNFKDIVDFFEILEDYKDDVLSQDKYDGKFVQRFITQDYDKCPSVRLREFLTEYFPSKKNGWGANWSACYNAISNKIMIPSDFRVKYLERRRSFDNFSQVLNLCFLHEIGHVHSKKCFKNVCNLVGMSAWPSKTDEHVMPSLMSNVMDNNEIYISPEHQIYIESDTMLQISNGGLILDEIINEIYTGALVGVCRFNQNDLILSENYYISNHYSNRYEAEEKDEPFYSSYFLHADIPAFLKAMFPNMTLFDMRNKTYNFKKALNSLKIDEEVRAELEEILNDFGYATQGIKAANKRIVNTKQDAEDGELIDFEVEEDFKKIGITSSHKLSFAELFFLALGVSYDNFELNLTEPENDDAFEIKAALQACLINAHKNNLLQQKKFNKNFAKKENLNKIFEGLVLIDFATIRAKDKSITTAEREFQNLLKELNLDMKYMHYRFYHKDEKLEKPMEL